MEKLATELQGVTKDVQDKQHTELDDMKAVVEEQRRKLAQLAEDLTEERAERSAAESRGRLRYREAKQAEYEKEDALEEAQSELKLARQQLDLVNASLERKEERCVFLREHLESVLCKPTPPSDEAVQEGVQAHENAALKAEVAALNKAREDLQLQASSASAASKGSEAERGALRAQVADLERALTERQAELSSRKEEEEKDKKQILQKLQKVWLPGRFLTKTHTYAHTLQTIEERNDTAEKLKEVREEKDSFAKNV